MDCQQAEPLIPSYLDGELSEASAAPLRRHLLDCQPCRAGAQGERNLKRWFPASAVVPVPRGFAARVARRAFAGDVGEVSVLDSLPRLRPVPPARVVEPDERILQFVLGLTAAAALVLIALAVSMRSSSLPSGSSLRAADGRDQISVEKALESLERLNQAERGERVVPVEGRKP